MENNKAKPKMPKTKGKSTNCIPCYKNDVKSKSKQCDDISTVKNQKVQHYRQSTLSEYFSKQDVKNSHDAKSQELPVMVNFNKLINQLFNAKVVVERFSEPKLCKFLEDPKLQVDIERLQVDSQQSKPLEENNNLQNQSKSETHYKPNKVRRFCHKCKASYIDEKNVTARKKCVKCGTDLFYVCLQCNNNVYLLFRSLTRHRKSCNAQKKSNSQALKSVKLIHCMDCEYFTAYEPGMKLHIFHTNHRVFKRLKE